MITLIHAFVVSSVLCASDSASEPRVPILYSTDLLHPHDDPDDHYDLACLFAIREFDVRGIVLDQGDRQTQRCGRPAVEQMSQMTGRHVPWAIGLSRKLRSRTDEAREEPEQFQGGVDLILSVLRASKEKVTIFTTGSCRDLAAAFNREPELLREKVRAAYINVGRGPNEKQDEWNVRLDPAAYLRLFESGLPLFWCPCVGKDDYQTLYVADQSTVVGECIPAVQNYFVYCLSKSKADPIEFLRTGPHPVPTGPRRMWCTGPMLHAAGRKVYQRGGDDFVALPPTAAANNSLAGREVETFRFVPVRVTLADDDKMPLRVEVDAASPNACVLSSADRRYGAAMAACLKHLLAALGQ